MSDPLFMETPCMQVCSANLQLMISEIGTHSYTGSMRINQRHIGVQQGHMVFS